MPCPSRTTRAGRPWIRAGWLLVGTTGLGATHSIVIACLSLCVFILTYCASPCEFRHQDFQTPRLDCNTSPDTANRANTILAVLRIWSVKAGNPDQLLVARILQKALENLIAPCQTSDHTKGQIHLSQVIAYSIDQGFELQQRKGTILPVFPDRAAWTAMIDDMLSATQAVLALMGYPVFFETELPPDTYSNLTVLSRAEKNLQLLEAEFPQLDFTNYHNLLGETLFFQDRVIMPAPQLPRRSRILVGIWRLGCPQHSIALHLCMCPRHDLVLSVEDRPIAQVEWVAGVPTVGGGPGDVAFTAKKIWMQFYHVYAVQQVSETDTRTGVRELVCPGLSFTARTICVCA
jgi:hypothetical protein